MEMHKMEIKNTNAVRMSCPAGVGPRCVCGSCVAWEQTRQDRGYCGAIYANLSRVHGETTEGKRETEKGEGGQGDAARKHRQEFTQELREIFVNLEKRILDQEHALQDLRQDFGSRLGAHNITEMAIKQVGHKSRIEALERRTEGMEGFIKNSSERYKDEINDLYERIDIRSNAIIKDREWIAKLEKRLEDLERKTGFQCAKTWVDASEPETAPFTPEINQNTPDDEWHKVSMMKIADMQASGWIDYTRQLMADAKKYYSGADSSAESFADAHLSLSRAYQAMDYEDPDEATENLSICILDIFAFCHKNEIDLPKEIIEEIERLRRQG